MRGSRKAVPEGSVTAGKIREVDHTHDRTGLSGGRVGRHTG